MGRNPRCGGGGSIGGLRKGPWTPDEDQKLVSYIEKNGPGNWRTLPNFAGLNRCGKSCRLRWINYLRPDINRGKFTSQEEQTILNLHAILGNKWSTIASQLPGRTDNEIKNFWNTHLKKKLIRMGFDPVTHQPHTDIFASLPHFMALANLRELVVKHNNNSPNNLQSEFAKLQYLHFLLHPPNPSAPTLQDTTTNTALSLLKALFPMNAVDQNHTTTPQMTQQFPISRVDGTNLRNDPNVHGEPMIPDSTWLASASFQSPPPNPDLPPASMVINQPFRLNEMTTIGEKQGGDTSAAASTSDGESNIINSSFWSDLLNQI